MLFGPDIAFERSADVYLSGSSMPTIAVGDLGGSAAAEIALSDAGTSVLGINSYGQLAVLQSINQYGTPALVADMNGDGANDVLVTDQYDTWLLAGAQRAKAVGLDPDGDGLCASRDVCPAGSNVLDGDRDGIVDGCDGCLGGAGGDSDLDGVCAAQDVCALGDDALDADCGVDALASNGGGQLWRPHGQNGAFRVASTGLFSMPWGEVIDVHDYDRDGHLDALVNRNDGVTSAIEIFYGDGSGAFDDSVALPNSSGEYMLSATSGDVDGDGVRDVFVRSRTQVVLGIAATPPARGFANTVIAPASAAWVSSATMANFDADPGLEIAAVATDWSSYSGTLHVYDFVGGTLVDHALGGSTPTGAAVRIASGNIDGDARPDLVLLRETCGYGCGTVDVLLGSAPPPPDAPPYGYMDNSFGFELRAWFFSDYANTIALADLVGDARDEVGDGTYRELQRIDSGTQTLHFADYEGDGDQDLFQLVWTMAGAAVQPWLN